MGNVDCSKHIRAALLEWLYPVNWIQRGRGPFTRTILEELVKTKKSSVGISARYANLLGRIILEWTVCEPEYWIQVTVLLPAEGDHRVSGRSQARQYHPRDIFGVFAESKKCGARETAVAR
jgi:hypothetical protein